MSIATLIKAHVGPLLTGGCHHTINRSTTINKPYAVFYQIAATPENGISGYLGKTRYRYQLDVFASTMEAAEGLALGSVKTAVENGINGTLIFHADGDYSEEDRTFQYITEFLVWSD